MKSFHHFHFWNQEKVAGGSRTGMTYMCTKNSVAISFFLAVSDELKVSDFCRKKKNKYGKSSFPQRVFKCQLGYQIFFWYSATTMYWFFILIMSCCFIIKVKSGIFSSGRWALSKFSKFVTYLETFILLLIHVIHWHVDVCWCEENL